MSRLPTIGGDANNWGTVLIDFINQAHNADGTLIKAAIGPGTPDRIRANSLGIVAETYPLGWTTLSSSTSVTPGLEHLLPITLYAGQVVTGMGVMVTVSGIGCTLAKFGIYQSVSTNIVSYVANTATNDFSTSLTTSNGWKSAAIAAGPWTVPTTDMYYVGYLQVGSTQSPQLAQMAQGGFSSNAIGPNNRVQHGGISGQTDINTSNSQGLQNTNGFPWVALY